MKGIENERKRKLDLPYKETEFFCPTLPPERLKEKGGERRGEVRKWGEDVKRERKGRFRLKLRRRGGGERGGERRENGHKHAYRQSDKTNPTEFFRVQTSS
jgi:hypothetical protein